MGMLALLVPNARIQPLPNSTNQEDKRRHHRRRLRAGPHAGRDQPLLEGLYNNNKKQSVNKHQRLNNKGNVTERLWQNLVN